MDEIKQFADYLIEWIVQKNDIELDRRLEFEIIRVIVDSVEMYREERVGITSNDKML